MKDKETKTNDRKSRTHRATLPIGDGGPGTGAVCTYFSWSQEATKRL